MVTTATYPVAPEATPVEGTLLDAATVTDDFRWLDGEGLFESFNCMRFEADAEFCAPNDKTFTNSPSWQDGFRFAAYGGAVCKAVGLDVEGMESAVERVFTMGESTAVERALMQTRFRASANNWDAPVDLTPVAGPVKPAVGVAMLEGYSGSIYVGTPTIHMPISIASLLLGVNGVELNERVLRTRLGSKIAAGAGYDYPNYGPTGVEPAEGEKWLYATGEVVVGRGPAIVRQAMATDTNEVFVLAERGYIAAVDCFTAAVRVTVTA